MDSNARIKAFHDLHRTGCFLMPNPWDVGTARWLRGCGFKALATTSAGFAFTQGRADQDVPLEMMLAHIAQIVAAVPDVPVNADFENGYADSPEGVARNVLACAATGVAGLSIEDATGRAADPLYPEAMAIERIIAAREALDKAGSGVMLTARAEGMLVGDAGGLDAVCRRIAAFAKAGADVLYAPVLRTEAEMRAVIDAANGKPVNILNFADLGHSVASLAGIGARRISIGAALARAAWAGFIEATRLISEEGSFAGFARNGVTQPIEPFFRDDLKQRSGA
ncbi:MAG: isocitrate lyase/PEP mutase family protein [Bosea sp. (in: a-proteobacteria)]